MTPQAFSFPTIGNNGKIYVPPYGLNEVINYMLKIDPDTYEVNKIFIDVDNTFEKWQYGITYKNKIFFLPYNESKILIIDTNNDSIDYINVPFAEKGKYIKSHVHQNKLIALPYGDSNIFDNIISLNLDTYEINYKNIFLNVNDEKKWHTSQYMDGKIYAVPRGEKWTPPYFSYAIILDCDSLDYQLFDLSEFWKDYDQENFTNKKYTTLAKVGNKLYAPPYSENSNFDVLLKFDGSWHSERTNLQSTSRKYFSHVSSNNGKIYFPPAGHEEDWSELLILDTKTDQWKTVSVGVKKESKKYFTGWENSIGKIFFIPRGGCVCQPTDEWKKNGDLTELLVVNSSDDSFYTIDLSDQFKDITTIEKFNGSVIIDNNIWIFPYGQEPQFQSIFVFDTIKEKIIKRINLDVI